MAFQIVLNSAITPLGDDLESRVISFLMRIGYISENNTREAILKSVPYRLFMECFLRRRNKLWEIDELESFLKATRATVYRHLNRLKSLDLVEESSINSEETGYVHKGYKLRFGNLSRAWIFVEVHMRETIKHYRRTVESIQEVLNREFSLEGEEEP